MLYVITEISYYKYVWTSQANMRHIEIWECYYYFISKKLFPFEKLLTTTKFLKQRPIKTLELCFEFSFFFVVFCFIYVNSHTINKLCNENIFGDIISLNLSWGRMFFHSHPCDKIHRKALFRYLVEMNACEHFYSRIMSSNQVLQFYVTMRYFLKQAAPTPPFSPPSHKVYDRAHFLCVVFPNFVDAVAMTEMNAWPYRL